MHSLIFIFSIFLITLFFWLLNKALPFRICPICAGVSLTWLGILAGITVGVLEAGSWKLFAAIAMGGTVVGIAYQGERKYPELAKNIFQWKVPVILAGFLFVRWSLENIGWFSLGIELVILGMVFYWYFLRRSTKEAMRENKTATKVRELEKKLENCCD
jgi:hypothetical protein